MNTYIVEYTFDKGATMNTALVSAKDYTGAYLETSYRLPMGVIITEIFEVK